MPDEIQQEGLLQGLARAVPLGVATYADTLSGRNQAVPLVQSILPPTPEEQMMIDLQKARLRQQIDSDKLRGILGLQQLEMQSQELDREQALGASRAKLANELAPGSDIQDQLRNALIREGKYGPVLSDVTKENKTSSHAKKLKGVIDEKEFVDLSLSPGYGTEDVRRAANTELNIREMNVSDIAKQLMRVDQAKTDELQKAEKIGEDGGSTERQSKQRDYVKDFRKQFATELDSLSPAEIEMIAEFMNNSLQKLALIEIKEWLQGVEDPGVIPRMGAFELKYRHRF